MDKRAGLRALPKNWPRWLRVVRHYLGGLRRKDLDAYRGIRGRMADNWPELAPIWDRLVEKYRAAKGWHSIGTLDDAGTLCALVLECVAWWAAEERNDINPTREAADTLLELQDRIDSAIDALCAAVADAESLSLRFGLKVNGPMWADNLGGALAETAHRFGRWGNQAEVTALIDHERMSHFQPRPGVLDLVRSARSAGVVDSDLAAPTRSPYSGEWLRVNAPEVHPEDERAAEALRIRNGSKSDSEAAQLRVLFASLRKLADGYSSRAGEPGPLEWLTAEHLSRLCCVAIGDNRPGRGPHRWGCPAEGFALDTVRSARRDFVVHHSNNRKT